MTTVEVQRKPLGDVSNKENLVPMKSKNQAPSLPIDAENGFQQVSQAPFYGKFYVYDSVRFVFGPWQMEVEEEAATIARVKQMESEEPLLQENPRRFVLFPITHPDIWQFYKKAEGEFLVWVATCHGALASYGGSLLPANSRLIMF